MKNIKQDGKEYKQKQHFEWLIKTKDIRFVSTDISVSFLRPFALLMLYVS